MKKLLFSLLLLSVALLVYAIIIQFLWNNALVPAITVAREIDFLQAMGIGLLFNIAGSVRTLSDQNKPL
jgi:hypothetical protein